jgi:hypothetical protein
VATEAAWLNGNNLEKEEIKKKKEKKERKNGRKVLTLTGLLMEGVGEDLDKFIRSGPERALHGTYARFDVRPNRS